MAAAGSAAAALRSIGVPGPGGLPWPSWSIAGETSDGTAGLPPPGVDSRNTFLTRNGVKREGRDLGTHLLPLGGARSTWRESTRVPTVRSQGGVLRCRVWVPGQELVGAALARAASAELTGQQTLASLSKRGAEDPHLRGSSARLLSWGQGKEALTACLS